MGTLMLKKLRSCKSFGRPVKLGFSMWHRSCSPVKVQKFSRCLTHSPIYLQIWVQHTISMPFLIANVMNITLVFFRIFLLLSLDRVTYLTETWVPLLARSGVRITTSVVLRRRRSSILSCRRDCVASLSPVITVNVRPYVRHTTY